MKIPKKERIDNYGFDEQFKQFITDIFRLWL